MAKKLAIFLSKLAQMTPEEFDEYFESLENTEDSIIEAEFIDDEVEDAGEVDLSIDLDYVIVDTTTTNADEVN